MAKNKTRAEKAQQKKEGRRLSDWIDLDSFESIRVFLGSDPKATENQVAWARQEPRSMNEKSRIKMPNGLWIQGPGRAWADKSLKQLGYVL